MILPVVGQKASDFPFHLKMLPKKKSITLATAAVRLRTRRPSAT